FSAGPAGVLLAGQQADTARDLAVVPAQLGQTFLTGGQALSGLGTGPGVDGLGLGELAPSALGGGAPGVPADSLCLDVLEFALHSGQRGGQLGDLVMQRLFLLASVGQHFPEPLVGYRTEWSGLLVGPRHGLSL